MPPHCMFAFSDDRAVYSCSLNRFVQHSKVKQHILEGHPLLAMAMTTLLYS